jgi:hypothetical protein
MHRWAPDVIGAVGQPEPNPDGYLAVFFAGSSASRKADKRFHVDSGDLPGLFYGELRSGVGLEAIVRNWLPTANRVAVLAIFESPFRSIDRRQPFLQLPPDRIVGAFLGERFGRVIHLPGLICGGSVSSTDLLHLRKKLLDMETLRVQQLLRSRMFHECSQSSLGAHAKCSG